MRFTDLFGQRVPLPESDVLQLGDAGTLQSSQHAPHTSIAYAIRTSSRRRTLRLELRADGLLIVVAPNGLSLGVIRNFVASRRAWIEDKRALLDTVRSPVTRNIFQNGARLPYLGNELELEVLIAPARRTTCCRASGSLALRVAHSAAIRPAVENWYRREAASHAAARLAHFAPQVGRAPRKLVIRAQRTRWGSCSARGTISLNWRLMQATTEIFDYVVVHELCHLLEPNHSVRFWGEVARILPDYRQQRAALRDFSRALLF